MGAYLSEPITRKETASEENDLMSVASSSMQGWRVSQEDAHNAILEFDKDSSFFAVFDGHGGHEVAKYCSLKLPDFIKSKDDYKNGNIDKALVDAFVDFDKTLVTREIVNELKKIAGTECDDEEHDDPAEVDNLYEEATMPIEDVMAKYGREPTEVTNGQKTKKQGESSAPKKPLTHPAIAELSKKSRKPISPYLRGKSVSRLDGVAKKSEISDDGDKADTTTLKELSESQNDEVFNADASDASKDTKLKSDQVTPKSDDSKPKSEESPEVKPESIEVKAKSEDSTVSEESVEVKPKTEKLNDKLSTTNEKTSKLSGEPSQDEKSNNTLATSESSNGHSEESEKPTVNGTTCISIKGKGKGKGKSSMAKIVDEVKSDDLPCPKESVEKKRAKSAEELYQNMLVADSDGDDEDLDDDEDENFGESEDDSDDYEDMESGEEEEEDTEEEEDDEEETNGESFGGNFNEEPGNDSGCTAVVALIRGTELYVANAGDSRCIVCRDGKAVDMSEDHKPEDAPEMSRIEKAGGHVTPDGRVNGGLNLSRAIGDHAYKNNPYLPLTEQMISPVPDIRRLTLDPSRDSYVFLACDGIWNSLSSQETVDFINERLQKKENVTPKFLETICEELFEHCLAPDTMGDGTGCDNMTAVLVKLKPTLLSKTKRTAMEDDDDDVDKSSQVAKKPKLDIDTEEEGGGGEGSSVKKD